MTYKKTGRLILDSSNPNVTYDSINNIFTFPLSQPITMRKYLKLQGSQIPNAHYNFENNVNNWVDVGVVLNGGSAIAYNSFQITAGNYAITDLVTLLQTQFTALGLTWTVSYSDQTSLLSISLTGGQFQLLFNSGSHASQSAWESAWVQTKCGHTRSINADWKFTTEFIKSNICYNRH